MIETFSISFSSLLFNKTNGIQSFYAEKMPNV